jgi:cob(I)alamin adenosyltransferase
VKIYTRTGDKGETSLLGGQRVAKSEKRIELYGDVDELNSHLGFFISLIEDNPDLDRVNARCTEVQNQLFNLGSLLACESSQRSNFKLKGVPKSLIESLENDIDMMNLKLPELKNFIIPGGSQAVAYAHVCRAFSRRVERELVDFIRTTKETELDEALVFLNRLSDYLFTVARYVGFTEGVSEKIWKA